jgi:putative hydrolase of the HAD superfamily
MTFIPRAITLDLDDTIWPIAPVVVKAENALVDWLRAHAPRTAARWPLQAMRALRDAVAREHPQHAHDFTRQRMISLERMFVEAGDDPALAHPAFEAFFAARCDVEHYDGSVEALERMARRVPLAALSNGNACLRRIGLMPLFRFQLGAREHGAAKPAASIFHAACRELHRAPHEVLHVGDDVEMDILGAARAGLRTCWINRPDHHAAPRAWPHTDIVPDLEFPDLTALADWLDAQVLKESDAA